MNDLSLATPVEEHRTSEFVAGKLTEFGCDVHCKIGKTGVVGVLRTGNGPSIGLRADMGAARYLAETRNFAGTVHFIFQPAEEIGGAKVMLQDGLFEHFPLSSACTIGPTCR